MKQLFYLLLAAVIVLSLVSGCAKAPDAPHSTQEDIDANKDPLLYDYDLSEYVVLGDYHALDFDENDYLPTEDELRERERIDFGGKTVDRAAAEGDTVYIDYIGKKDGVAFAGGTADNQALTLGSHTFIDGFEDGLIGVTPGETVDLNLSFPDPYPNNPDLAGAPVVFTVTLRYIEDPEGNVPALKDETVAMLSNYESYADYQSTVSRILFLQNANAALWKLIWESAEFISLPADAVEAYYNRTLDALSAYAAQYGYSIEDYVQRYSENNSITTEEFYEKTRKDAEEDVKYDLILHTIERAENVRVTDTDENDVLQQLLLVYGTRYGFQNTDEVRANLEESVLQKNELYYAVLRVLREQAKT